MPSTKSTNLGSRYLAEGSSEREEILQLDRMPCYMIITTQIVELWLKGSMGRQNSEGCKNCNAFLVRRLAEPRVQRNLAWSRV